MEITLDLILEVGVGPMLFLCLLLIVMDTLMGIYKALRDGIFDARLLPQFLKTGVLPYIGAMMLLAAGVILVGGVLQPIMMGFFVTAVIFLVAKYSTDIYEKIDYLIKNKPDLPFNK